MEKYTIGKKIAFLRKKNGYTQEKLSNAIGVSPQTISKWESEITMPDIMLLPVIANIFDISLDELFNENKTKEIEMYNFDLCAEKTYDAILESMYKSWAHADKNTENIEEFVHKTKNMLFENEHMQTIIRSYPKGIVFANSKLAFVYTDSIKDSIKLLENNDTKEFISFLNNETAKKIILYCHDKYNQSFTLKSLTLKLKTNETEIKKNLDLMCKFKLMYTENVENDNDQITIYKPYGEYKLYLLLVALSLLQNLATHQESFYGFRG